MRLTDLLLRFTFLGAEWTLWLLVALSILSVAVMVERALYFRGRRVDIELLVAQVEAAVRAGNLEQALRAVRGSKAIECVVLHAGLSEMHRGAHAVGEAMASAKARERLQLESRLAVLGTLGSNAPFIGLLGTVLGIIVASHELSQAQAAQTSAAGAVMAGVFEALVATAVGLMVAIPAVVAFNIFQRRVRRTLGRVDFLAHRLLSLLPAEHPPTQTASPKRALVPDGR
jgi:biopolymer transport protein ExbB